MIVETHKKVSREVTNEDIPRVLAEVERMKAVFQDLSCVAIAHPQVESKDPLRLYVTRNGEVFINPVIKRHSNYTVDSDEGCMSFPGRPQIIKKRWRKVDLTYQSIEDGKLTEPIDEYLAGFPAFIAQHEIDHLNAIYCYEGIEE